MKKQIVIERDTSQRLLCDEFDGQDFFSIEDYPGAEPRHEYYRPEKPGVLHDGPVARGIMIAAFTAAIAWFGLGCAIAYWFRRFPWQS